MTVSASCIVNVIGTVRCKFIWQAQTHFLFLFGLFNMGLVLVRLVPDLCLESETVARRQMIGVDSGCFCLSRGLVRLKIACILYTSVFSPTWCKPLHYCTTPTHQIEQLSSDAAKMHHKKDWDEKCTYRLMLLGDLHVGFHTFVRSDCVSRQETHPDDGSWSWLAYHEQSRRISDFKNQNWWQSLS